MKDKSILIIDTPKTCKECPLKVDDRLPTSCIFRRWHSLSVNETYATNSWCPLKPVPKKKNLKDLKIYRDDSFVKQGYLIGYNECIDDIEGGNE